MWKNILTLGGTIKNKDKSEFNEDDFFKFLEENGFEFSGTYDIIVRDEMIIVIDKVVENVNSLVVERMLEQCKNLYGQDSTIETLKETLIYNGGTGSFGSLFSYSMTEEINDLIYKYSNSNWEIGDEFDAILGEEVAQKIDELTI